MRYYIIAGEASGDLHGSNLMKGLYAEDPEAEVRFWGGDLMLAAVSEAGAGRGALVRHYREGAVMGISDVLGKAGRLLGNVRACKADIAAWRPDAVILIDYPGFNFKIAKFAHGAGFKVFYYIAPKTWASREGRNRKLRKYVDRLFIVFPFEVPYFEKRGIPFVYKGNPLVDAVDSHVYSRPVEGSYIALLAGSRKGEISRMMPVCMEAADRLGCKVVVELCLACHLHEGACCLCIVVGSIVVVGHIQRHHLHDIAPLVGMSEGIERVGNALGIEHNHQAVGYLMVGMLVRFQDLIERVGSIGLAVEGQ